MPVLGFPTETILIAGPSSGNGAAFARSLAARGASLVLVARRRDRPDALAAELRAARGVTVTAITQDLGSPPAGAELSAAVDAAGLHVTGIINEAGFGTFGDFVEEDPDRLAQEIAVDISAPV